MKNGKRVNPYDLNEIVHAKMKLRKRRKMNPRKENPYELSMGRLETQRK